MESAAVKGVSTIIVHCPLVGCHRMDLGDLATSKNLRLEEWASLSIVGGGAICAYQRMIKDEFNSLIKQLAIIAGLLNGSLHEIILITHEGCKGREKYYLPCPEHDNHPGITDLRLAIPALQNRLETSHKIKISGYYGRSLTATNIKFQEIKL